MVYGMYTYSISCPCLQRLPNMHLQSIIGRPIRFHQPEYTGENRCLPCTAVNLALAAGVASIVALVSPLAALAVGVGALTSIYYRGYFVPGTPALTQRYLPEQILALFDKNSAPTTISEIDPAVVLIGADVLVDEPGAPDVSLNGVFATRWETRTSELLHDEQRIALDALAKLIAVPSTDLRIRTLDDAATLFLDDEHFGTWESAAAFCADVAGMELLAERVDGWNRYGLDVQSEVAGTLRLFVERCPDCGGDVTLNEETVSSCCSMRDIVAVTCTTCAIRLLEVSVTADELRSPNESVSTVE